MADDAPSDFFRAYLAPLSIDPGAARIAERWAATKAWASKASKNQLPALVAAMCGAATEADLAMLGPFFQAHVEADESFNTVNAEAQIRVLAAAALDFAFTFRPELDSAASLAVLTSSWGGRNPTGLAVDIVSRAEAEIDSIAASARIHEDIDEPIRKLSVAGVGEAVTAFQQLSEQGIGADAIGAAIDDAFKAINKAISTHASGLRSVLKAISRRLDQVDEESDVLWYVFGGVSDDARLPFSEVGPERAALFAPREIAEISSKPLRTEAVQELFKRCGANESKIGLAKAIEAMRTEWIVSHVPADASPSLFPIHHALRRYVDLVEPGAWVAGWAKATGLSASLELESNALATAFYRERLLLAELA
jgi:hypothetical protein